MRARTGVWVALASALIGGCVSGGNNGLGGDRHVTWLDDGMMMTATVGKATWASSGGRDSVDMIGNNDSAGIEIYVAAPTPFTAQTFVCSQTTPGQALLLTYRNGDPAGPAFMHQSCTVAFTQIGAVGGASITGTFEIVFALPSGGTKSITNGSFDLPLSK
jgi:hypothetical protein